MARSCLAGNAVNGIAVHNRFGAFFEIPLLIVFSHVNRACDSQLQILFLLKFLKGFAHGVIGECIAVWAVRFALVAILLV